MFEKVMNFIVDNTGVVTSGIFRWTLGNVNCRPFLWLWNSINLRKLDDQYIRIFYHISLTLLYCMPRIISHFIDSVLIWLKLNWSVVFFIHNTCLSNRIQVVKTLTLIWHWNLSTTPFRWRASARAFVFKCNIHYQRLDLFSLSCGFLSSVYGSTQGRN